MRKKTALLIACIFCLSLVFSGCNLFTQDTNAYYHQTVATVEYQDGSQIVISKEELIQAYSRYGENLLSSGKTQAEAVDYLVDFLINQKVLIKETENLIKNQKVEFTITQKNEVWTSAYKNVLSLLADYEKQINESLKKEEPSVLEEETEKKVFEAYNAEAYVDKNDKGEYVVFTYADNSAKDTKLIYDGEVIDTIISAVDNKIGDNPILKEAKRRYINYLTERAKSFHESSDESTVWYNEIKRVYDYALNNKYIEIYEKHLLTVNNTNNVSPISVNDILKYTENQIKASYNYYSLDAETYASDILKSRENVHYFLNDASIGDFFYVSHILVKFTDEQTADLKALKEKFEGGGVFTTQQEYKNARQVIINQTLAKSFGEETSLTITELYNKLSNDLTGKSAQEKVNVFNEYFYEYNEDEGAFNGDYAYIVGTEKTEMVESFTDAARDLYNNGNGQLGDLSGMVESEYGIHILFYLEPVQNMFTITNINTFSLTDNLAENIQTITTTKLSQLNTKTVFDAVYEKLKSDKISQLEELNLNILKENLTIKTIPSHYQDMK